MDIITSSHELTGLSKINVILGKNGCGKSTLLKNLDALLDASPDFGNIKYITPERGGNLVHEAGIEQQVFADKNWMPSTRRVNQFTQFRQQTVTQYRRLETSILRRIEASVNAGNKTHPKTFNSVLRQINKLLDNIEIRRDTEQGPVFKIYKKSTGEEVDARFISSGEAELISLGIECLAFADSIIKGSRNVLLLDEPDVHLHPDLQGKLVDFIVQLVKKDGFEIILATHSTALLGELAYYDDVAVSLMVADQKNLVFEKIDEAYKKILPMFGAHPLSNIFNMSPILLVEGEDDERIWQQAVRSSQGSINIYPVVCGSVDVMSEYEQRVKSIIRAVYDNARAYSLRDRDEGDEEIANLLSVVRMKLSCRAAENLILSDDVLSDVGVVWEDVKNKIDAWLADDNNKQHVKYKHMVNFKNTGYDRKNADLKEIRLLLVADMLESNKPWEVLVGKVLAKQKRIDSPNDDSMQNYLGNKVVKYLLPVC